MAAKFSGHPKTIWVANSADNDRKMRLIEEFWFEDRAGKKWITPADYLIDGASIPRPLWALIGSPYTGQYRRASIVHDKACDGSVDALDDRRAADRMFYEGCRAGGCSWFESAILYAGVRIGGIWSQMTPALAFEAQQQGPRINQAPMERAMIAEFQYMADQITRQGETDDPAEIERRADAVEQSFAQLRTTVLPAI